MKKHFSVLHILDSMSNNSRSTRETKQLQCIMLKHFEGENFKEGRIAANVAQVNSFVYFYFSSFSTNSQNDKCFRYPAKLMTTTAAAL
jgi:hypothetical protein